ncbi:MAG: mechanosensitive ion channel domain-containing protein [Pseudomonadota bacterium]|nr:mechanosensitive ion channel domain-containing protein [Pseudomonadota bacterium]
MLMGVDFTTIAFFAFVLIALGGLIWWVQRAVAKILDPKENGQDEGSQHDQSENYFDLIKFPLVIWLVSLALFIVLQLTPWNAIQFIDGDIVISHSQKFMRAITVIVLFVVALRLLNRSENQWLHGDKKISDQVEYVAQIGYKAVKFLLYAIVTITILNIFELTYLANQLFAVGAISSFVIGFAAQDTLANFFGSLMVILDRPFKINDLIDSPDKNIKGFVEHIGWRSTRVRDLNHGIKFVPNNNFSKITIINLSKSKVRKYATTVGIRYQDIDRVSDICRDIEDAIKSMPETAKTSLCYARFSGLGSSSVDFKVVTSWRCNAGGLYDDYVDKILHMIVTTVAKHKAGFPYPTTTLDAEDLVAALRDKK